MTARDGERRHSDQKDEDTEDHVASDTAGTLDEAYLRLHQTGPEYDGWLSNHGPMAAEAMARHGHAENVGPWLDGYVSRLEEFPRGSGPIGPSWPEALGDPRRIADWTAFFWLEADRQPWRQLLGTWWLRLLPALSQDLWAPSAAAAWDAAAALTAIYTPPVPAPPATLPAAPTGPGAGDETFARAVDHGDEHVIKFADTAAEVHARTGNPAALAAAVQAVELIPRPD